MRSGADKEPTAIRCKQSSTQPVWALHCMCHTQNIHKIWTYSTKHFRIGTLPLGPKEQPDGHLHNLEAEWMVKMERKKKLL